MFQAILTNLNFLTDLLRTIFYHPISANFSYPEGSISFDSFDFSGEPACMTSRPEYLKCVRAPFEKGNLHRGG